MAMTLKNIASGIVFTCMACAASAQVTSGRIENRQVSGSWESFSIANGNDIRLRATGSDGKITLIADDYLPDCKIDLSIATPISTPMGETPSSRLPGAIRIDDGPLHVISYVSAATVMGDTAVYATVDYTPDFSTILTEMMVGSIVRLKIGNGPTDPIVTVPLNGFAVSLDRIRAWCKSVQDYLATRPTGKPKSKKPIPSAPSTVL